MDEFITAHPEVAYALLCAAGGIIVYLWRQNKAQEKSALLSEVKKVADAIESLANQMAVLFKKDDEKGKCIEEICGQLNGQEQRCTEREHNCPGRLAGIALLKQREKDNV